eukprot:jgi/Botrbrau1/10435/Bobra.0133s0042.1
MVSCLPSTFVTLRGTQQVLSDKCLARSELCLRQSWRLKGDRRIVRLRTSETPTTVRVRAIWSPGAFKRTAAGLSSGTPVYTMLQPLPDGNVQLVLKGSWWTVAVLACITIICLASAATAFFAWVRPVLLQFDKASRQMEKAAEEMEKAAIVMNTELPNTLEATERASLQFEELGETLKHGERGTEGLRSRAAPLPAVQ